MTYIHLIQEQKNQAIDLLDDWQTKNEQKNKGFYTSLAFKLVLYKTPYFFCFFIYTK
jgi:hypothetical protein